MSTQKVCDLCTKPIKEGIVNVQATEYSGGKMSMGSELEIQDFHQICYSKLQAWLKDQRHVQSEVNRL